MALAEFRDFSYAYPHRQQWALEAVTAEIEPGLTLVAGPSGGGKSTLLRTLNGLVPHFHGGTVRGDVGVCGSSVVGGRTRDLSQLVGFVFQDPEDQFVYSTVRAEVAFGLENLGVARLEMIKRVDDVLSEVGIADLGDRRLDSLSGGERQRVALAGALVLRPALVALDEPTSQLDNRGAADLVDACARLSATGTAVIVAEHRLEGLTARAERGMRVAAGRVVSLVPADMIGRPARRRSSRQAGPTAWTMTDVSVDLAGVEILSRTNCHGRRGEVVALVGPNGGGKTTLLRTLAGLAGVRGGRVERPEVAAYLPQDPSSLLHRPTVRKEIQLTLDRRKSTYTVGATLRQFGIDDLADCYPRDLSSGQKQRVALAAAIAGNPELILLDEPTRGMDEVARDRLIAIIDELAASGASVVLATHDLELVEALADRVVDVANGAAQERPARPMPAAV